MSSPNLQTSQPLLPERIENARSLLVVLMLMAFLAGLALLFSRGANRMSDHWRAQLSNTATVQILHSSPDTQQAQMQSTLQTLQSLLPEADIQPLSMDESRSLLKPWIGNTDLPEDIPVPSLITVTKSSGAINAARISAALEAEGLLVNVDDHSQYARNIQSTTRSLVGLGMGLLSILLAAGLAVSIFATRAGLSAQRDIISVLVQVGASNLFISKLFIGQAGRRAMIGAAIGIGLAALFWLGLSVLKVIGDVGWQSPQMVILDLIWLIGLWIIFALICALAAGMTARRLLARERRRA